MTKKSEDNNIAMGIAMLIGSIGMICFCVACFFALVRCVPERGADEPKQVRDTIIDYVIDTIRYYEVKPKDSVVVRYVTERLPIAGDSTPSPLTPQSQATAPLRQGSTGTASTSLTPQSQGDGSPKGRGAITSPKQGLRGESDSVDVIIPITQKYYEDSTFSAWVSGYKPSLDSIYVFPRKEVQTITIHTKEQKRWSIGVSGGIGVVYDGGWHCGPGINVGVSYSF